jgi:hypothetical protein
MQHAYKTGDLAPDDLIAVERLLGRQLQNDEAVQVITYKVEDSRETEEAAGRRHAADRIRELAKGKSLGGISVRDLIDEGRRF